MLAIEARLFEEYKRVDKICRDMYSSQNGINQYIADMDQKFSYERSVVSSWDKDYRMLKRVRWLRNQIAHESSATECNEEDAAWLEEFHNRLLEQRDPLALLGKADREQVNYPMQRESKPIYSEQMAYRNAHLRKKKDSSLKRAVIVLVEVFIILFVAAIILTMIMAMK